MKNLFIEYAETYIKRFNGKYIAYLSTHGIFLSLFLKNWQIIARDMFILRHKRNVRLASVLRSVD